MRPGGAAQVTVQKGSGSSFTTLKSLTTDGQGYFRFTTTISKKTSLRFRYTDADGHTVTSSTMTVTPTKAKASRR